jgi:hypothetical protein
MMDFDWGPGKILKYDLKRGKFRSLGPPFKVWAPVKITASPPLSTAQLGSVEGPVISNESIVYQNSKLKTDGLCFNGEWHSKMEVLCTPTHSTPKNLEKSQKSSSPIVINEKKEGILKPLPANSSQNSRPKATETSPKHPPKNPAKKSYFSDK